MASVTFDMTLNMTGKLELLLEIEITGWQCLSMVKLSCDET